MSRILVIDDDVNLCKIITHQLQSAGNEVTSANSGEAGLAAFQRDYFDVVLSDLQMPDMNGMEVLKKIREKDPTVLVIMITAYGSIESAVSACKLGATDYLTKPFSKEQLLFTIEKALKLRNLQEENRQYRRELEKRYQPDGLVAQSPAMQKLMQMVYQVAESDATVLILGESGTGKELIARAIHYNSLRKDKPLITVSCPSIPENLLESELFGHIKGAFTGALKDRKGKFEMADGGTIFLDEIGDLPASLQAKLLRVLQEMEFERLGSSRLIKVNVRVIAATNKNLFEEVRDGHFREDLFYRLSVVPVQLPPLRERKEEIPRLAQLFTERYGRGQEYHLTPEALAMLQKYDWPGNIRQLENVIERAVVLSVNRKIDVESLPVFVRNNQTPQNPVSIEPFGNDFSLDEMEKKLILDALEKSGGNQSQAARLLKIPRHVLIYRLKKLGISE